MGVADRWRDWEEPQQGGGVRFRAPRLTSAVKLLLFVNISFFLALWLIPKFFGSMADDASVWAISTFGLFPSEWSLPWIPVWQPLTYGLLHDPGSLGHLFWNMLLLYFFGTMLEEVLGSSRFLSAYAGGAIAGAALHLFAALAGWVADKPAIGASGAILGVVVAAAVYKPRATVLFFFIPMSLKVLVSCLVAFDLYWAIESAGGAETGTAHWIHLGGAAFGFFGARMGWLQRDHFARFQARRAIQKAERTAKDAEVVDQLLEKISREGIGALSDREKEQLKRASERKQG